MKLAEEISRKLRAFWSEINSLEWKQGQKHPLTPVGIFRNVWMEDQIRARTKARCTVCDCAISDEEYKRRELVFACDKGKCLCTKPYDAGLKAHAVCDVCDAMFRAIYVNWAMKDRNYFKTLDEELAKLRGGEGRRRMGLD